MLKERARPISTSTKELITFVNITKDLKKNDQLKNSENEEIKERNRSYKLFVKNLSPVYKDLTNTYVGIKHNYVLLKSFN